MTDVTSRRFSAVAISIVQALGPIWQHFITDDASQIIAFPSDRTVFLRFVKAGGAAPAIAVEVVDEGGYPVDTPLDPTIWLLPFGMASVTAARQIRSGLIEPYRNGLKAEANLYCRAREPLIQDDVEVEEITESDDVQLDLGNVVY